MSERKKPPHGGFFLLGLVAGLGLTSVTHADDSISTGLLACAKLGDNLERLVCYDRLVAGLHKSAASPAVAAPAPPPVTASSGAQEMFGARPAPTPPPAAAAERTELHSITGHIVSLTEGQRSAPMLVLDNGQKWQQLGHEDLMLRVGERVVISRGTFNSFWIMTEDNRSSHVKRLLQDP